MKVLVIDVGGSHVKVLLSGEEKARRFRSGPELTPQQMIDGVGELTKDWHYDAISMGYPGLVEKSSIVSKPLNLGQGWVGFDFHKAFGVPLHIINDAAMQALGTYDGGRMLFLGLGTGLGTAMIFDGGIVPMELGHLPYKKKRSYEDYLGKRGLARLGKRRWRRHVNKVISLLRAALEPDAVVVGGGNAKKLHKTEGLRLGTNRDAFAGGFRLWDKRSDLPALTHQKAEPTLRRHR